MFNRTHRMTVSLSFIALFFIDDPSLASATLVSKDRPTLLEFASDAHCFRRPNHVGHRFDCYDPTNNWFISAFGHLFMEKAATSLGNLGNRKSDCSEWYRSSDEMADSAATPSPRSWDGSRFTQLSQWPYPASCYTGDYLFAFHSILFKKKVCWLSSAALSFFSNIFPLLFRRSLPKRYPRKYLFSKWDHIDDL